MQAVVEAMPPMLFGTTKDVHLPLSDDICLHHCLCEAHTLCGASRHASCPGVLRDELFVFFIFPFMPSCRKSIASAAHKTDGQVPALISKGCCKRCSAKPEAAYSVVFRQQTHGWAHRQKQEGYQEGAT
jgi:hypothetical protein